MRKLSILQALPDAVVESRSLQGLAMTRSKSVNGPGGERTNGSAAEYWPSVFPDTLL